MHLIDLSQGGAHATLSRPDPVHESVIAWLGFWLMTVAIAVPGMPVLWVLWRKGFVVASVRQPNIEDDGHEVLDGEPGPALAR